MRNHFLRAGGIPSSGGGGGGSSIITTNLFVHYDFGDTDCWTGNNSTNSADYTINNLANNHNDAVFRSKGTATSWVHSSVSDTIVSSTVGGGSLFNDSSEYDINDRGTHLIQGSFSHVVASSSLYNLDTVAATSSDNLFNGVGNGAYTLETWVKPFGNASGDSKQTGWNINTRSTGDYSLRNQLDYYQGGDDNYPNKFVYHSYTWESGNTGNTITEIGTVSGAPSSGDGFCNWNHIVYSRNSNATNDTKIYLNNSLGVTTTDDENYDYYRWGYTNLGINSSSVSSNYHAIFRFYKGKALTSSEVTTNWNAEKSRFGH